MMFRGPRASLLSRVASALPWWNPDGLTDASVCLGAWRAKGAASYAASLVDLTGNGNNLSEVGGGAVGWGADTGWLSDNAHMLNTGLVPASNLSWSVLFRCVGYTSVGASIIGLVQVAGGLIRFYIQPDGGAGKASYCHGGTGLKAPAATAGVFGFAGNKAYRNGVDEGITIGDAAGTFVDPIGLVGIYAAGVPSPCSIVGLQFHAAALYNQTLPAPQMLARSTAIAAL